MLNILFHIILSVLIYNSPAPQRMELQAIRKEARAEIFETQTLSEKSEFSVEAERGLGEKAGNHIEFAWDDAAILPCTACVPQSVNNSNNFKNQKRNHRRTASPKLHHSKCRILKSLPAKSESRGVARNPQSQDARQELTAAIRFLHLSALAC